MTEGYEGYSEAVVQVRDIMRENGLGKNWSHGWPHVERVLNHLETLLTTCEQLPVTAAWLRLAVLFHDVGRGEGITDHAQASAEIFEQLELDGLPPQKKEDIVYAIRNHSVGLQGTAVEKEKHWLLGLLVLFDHMDALGEEGFKRAEEFCQQNNIPLTRLEDLAIVRKILAGEKVNKQPEWKRASLSLHLAYNLLATEEIATPVRGCLSSEFQTIIEERKATLKQHLNEAVQG